MRYWQSASDIDIMEVDSPPDPIPLRPRDRIIRVRLHFVAIVVDSLLERSAENMYGFLLFFGLVSIGGAIVLEMLNY